VSEAEFVAAFRRGDDHAFRRMYAEYGRLVHAVAYHVLGERTLAEEATQLTFVKAWENAHTFGDDRPLAPWLAVIAKRVAIDVWRRERRRSHGPLDELTERHGPPMADSVEEVWSIRAALGELSDDAQALLRMQYHEGLSQQDVAERLGIPVGTVKSRTHTAQGRLARALRRVDVSIPGAPARHDREPS
jgi:RNA polymerase sigma-70 factor (ECF subfamily)